MLKIAFSQEQKLAVWLAVIDDQEGKLTEMNK